jgi:hypothetical protein
LTIAITEHVAIVASSAKRHGAMQEHSHRIAGVVLQLIAKREVQLAAGSISQSAAKSKL